MESSRKPTRRRKKAIGLWQSLLIVAVAWWQPVAIVLGISLLAGGCFWYLRRPTWQAHDALLLGKDQEADRLLKIANKRWPQRKIWRAEIRFLEARLARHRGKLREMGDCLVAARNGGYDVERLKREQILAQVQLGEMRGSEKRLARLLSDPQGDEPEICNAFVQGYVQIQQYAAARQLLNGWARDFPEDPRPVFIRGTVQLNIELWKEAEKDFRQALKIDPDHYQSAYHLASVLLIQKNPDQALKYFRLAARDKTLEADSLAGQGHCFRLLGNVKKAREILNKIQQRYPDNTTAKFELARLDIDDGNYQEAFKRLEPIVTADPQHSDARYQYAIVLREIGRTEEARDHFLAVKEIGKQLANANDLAEQITTDASSADTRLEIAKIHLQYGSRREGLMWLRSVLTFAPDHSEALTELEEYYHARFREEPKTERFNELAEEYHRRLEMVTPDTP